MSDSLSWRDRFLAPSHAIESGADRPHFVCGRSKISGGDSRVAVFLAPAVTGSARLSARFSVYGPPVLIVCADYACEQLGRSGIDTARCPQVQTIENTLALDPKDRFAIIAVQDAVADALKQLHDRYHDDDTAQ